MSKLLIRHSKASNFSKIKGIKNVINIGHLEKWSDKNVHHRYIQCSDKSSEMVHCYWSSRIYICTGGSTCPIVINFPQTNILCLFGTRKSSTKSRTTEMRNRWNNMGAINFDWHLRKDKFRLLQCLLLVETYKRGL
jgi:hypothetical protein